jgi:hypothetical protein
LWRKHYVDDTCEETVDEITRKKYDPGKKSPEKNMTPEKVPGKKHDPG